MIHSYAFAETINDKDTSQELVKKFGNLISNLPSGSSSFEDCKASYLGKNRRGPFLHAYGVGLDKSDIYKKNQIYGIFRLVLLPEFKDGVQKIQIITTYSKIDYFIYHSENEKIKIDIEQKKKIKQGEILRKEKYSFYVDSEANLLQTISNEYSDQEIVITYEPPVPLCRAGSTIHYARLNKPFSGIVDYKFVQDTKFENGFWDKKVFGYRELELDNKGILYSTDRNSYNHKNGWQNIFTDDLVSKSVIFLDEILPDYSE